MYCVLSASPYGTGRTQHGDCGCALGVEEACPMVLVCRIVRLTSSDQMALKARCAQCTGTTLEGA